MKIGRYIAFVVFCVAIGVIVLTVVRSHSKPTLLQDESKDELTTVDGGQGHSGDKSNSFEVLAVRTADESSSIDTTSDKVSNNQVTIESKIVRLIGNEQNPAWCKYAEVKGELDAKCIPILQNMLQNESYRNRWAQISHMMAWLSESRDRQAFTAICDYIRRPDTWSTAKTPTAIDHLYAKAQALGYLGLFDSDLSADVLRSAFTKAGAEDLIQEWVHFPHEIRSYSPEQFVSFFRGYASRGLILSREPNNIALVTESLNGEFHELRSSEHQIENYTAANEMEIVVYYLIIDSLAQNDMIEDTGLEEYLRVYNTDSWQGRIMPYLAKY